MIALSSILPTAKMHLKTPITFSLLTSFLVIAFFSIYLTRQQTWPQFSPPAAFFATPLHSQADSPLPSPLANHPPPPQQQTNLPLDAILLPDWEVLLISSPGVPIPTNSSTCLFQNNLLSPAIPTGLITFTRRTTFKCLVPEPLRHLWPPLRPILTNSSTLFPQSSPALLSWTFLTYDSISTERDVILFVKGVNIHQGINRQPRYLRCLFSNGLKTAVLTSNQEVFRCHHPQLRSQDKTLRVTLELKPENKPVPSVAYYYTPPPLRKNPKSLICACTMVYNVAKFLKEWIVYNGKIGVEKFFLYDNGSDDDLDNVVNDLVKRGYSVEIVVWPWSKTQEAGFSHCATYANDTCTWMMYVDVDEFVFSPTWLHTPSPSLLKSLLPKTRSKRSRAPQIGQVMIMCHDFGPSKQRSHPIEGVTQGYTCRSRSEQRHKSIVLLDAVDPSLVNVVHHFGLKKGFRGKKLGLGQAIVNHYKYQAWSEFKNKFKRRVSAYVVDWKQGVNPHSKDRTPGLGFEPIEPKGWANKFCSVRDYRLKELTRRWFGRQGSSGNMMAWQEY